MSSRRNLPYFILVLVISLQANLAQEEKSTNQSADNAASADVKPEDNVSNKTDQGSSNGTTENVTPQNKPEGVSAQDASTVPPVVPTDLICKICSCKDSTIDCNDKDVTTSFTLGDWAGVSQIAPKTVDLSDNELDELTPISNLPIETLNFSSCGISSIQQGTFKELQRMRVLDLSNNKLTTATLSPHIFLGKYSPTEYQPLSSMKILNLANNDLHSLSPDVFEHLPELEELNLSGNPFTVIDHQSVIAITNVAYLKVLDMHGCGIKDLPTYFLHTPRFLERLDLSDNKMDTISPEFERAKSLKYLNLNNNPIRYIVTGDDLYTSFPLVPSLRELHLSNMPILEEIRNYALGGLSGLEVLYITNNLALSYLEPKMLARKDEIGEGWDYPMLKELHLRSNNLTTIESELIGRWDKVTTIDIRYNPFLCDCSNQWMVDTLIPIIMETSASITTDIICREPIEMRGKSMVHLEEVHRHMRCLDKYGHRPENDGAVLIGTVIGLLLAVPIFLSLLLAYKRGYFSFCGLNGTAEISRAFYKRAKTEDFAF